MSVFCRVCLNQSEILQNIFDKYDSDLSFLEMLKEFASIQIEEKDLPTSICKKCACRLTDAYSFKQTLRNSERILEEFINQKAGQCLQVNEIKSEIEFETIEQQFETNDEIKIEENTDFVRYNSDQCKKLSKRNLSLEKHKTTKHLNILSRDKNLEVNKINEIENSYVSKNDVRDSSSTNKLQTLQIKDLIPHDIHVTNKNKENDNKFTCELCDKKFSNCANLKIHVETHEKRYRCNQCNETFLNSTDSLQHHLLKHSNAYKCETCNQVFTRKNNLDRHKSLHADGNLFVCHICKNTFTTRNEVSIHLKSHTEQLYSCDFCDKTFKIKSTMYAHRKSSHFEIKAHVCKICNRAYNRKTSLKVHSYTHTGTRPFNCTECEKGFLDKRSLLAHKLRDHPKSLSDKGEILQLRQYACTKCGKTYTSNFSLKCHMRTHENIYPHLCTICGKQFTDPRTLKSHVQAHSGVLRYNCKLCSKRYRYRAALTHHMRTHSDERPFLCSICGAKFKDSTALRYHIRTHSQERSYKCNICEKMYKMSWHLNQHMRTHFDDKRYPCDECSKAFYTSNRLKRHKLVHSNLREYKCQYCEKGFNAPNTLRVHILKHTKKYPHRCDLCGKGFIYSNNLRDHMQQRHTDTVDTDDNSEEILGIVTLF